MRGPGRPAWRKGLQRVGGSTIPPCSASEEPYALPTRLRSLPGWQGSAWLWLCVQGLDCGAHKVKRPPVFQDRPGLAERSCVAISRKEREKEGGELPVAELGGQTVIYQSSACTAGTVAVGSGFVRLESVLRRGFPLYGCPEATASSWSIYVSRRGRASCGICVVDMPAAPGGRKVWQWCLASRLICRP